jgi:enamine deaminase RidA (YjgF/YER057c/UK114 family)
VRRPITREPEDVMADDEAKMDEMYDQAAEIAAKHLDAALEEGGPLRNMVAIMMLEAAVNAAIDATSREDILIRLEDLVSQIEEDDEIDEED